MSHIREHFDEMLTQWEKMKTSDMDEAADDADRFQMTFYEFINCVRNYVSALPHAPADVESAWQDPEFSYILERMPEPLQIPFEMELEEFLAGHERQTDSTEQS